jgi:hypothetical protein
MTQLTDEQKKTLEESLDAELSEKDAEDSKILSLETSLMAENSILKDYIAELEEIVGELDEIKKEDREEDEQMQKEIIDAELES